MRGIGMVDRREQPARGKFGREIDRRALAPRLHRLRKARQKRG
jgi:hypothetical protein